MSPSDTTPPYALLNPELILSAIDSLGLRTDGRFLALNSFENRVYLLELEDGASVVAKFYRPGRWSDAAILEEHQFVAELAKAELPVVPPLAFNGTTLHHFAGFRFAVFERRGGRAPELDQADTLEWMGRFIARIHAVSECARFTHRLTLSPQTYGEASRDFVLESGYLPPDVRSAWQDAAAQALEEVHAAWRAAGDVKRIRTHGDCHIGNVLWTDRGPHFVDFDDCLSAPAVQDLWMLLSGEAEDSAQQRARLMTGYRCFRDFDPREWRLIEPLRTLRLLHYSAWLARRWDDPAFPAAFPWFNTRSYWMERVTELREQVRLMRESRAIDG